MKKKIYLESNFFFLLFIVFTLSFVIKTGAIYNPDSQGYLNMDIYRSAGYPLFIALHKFLFGSKYISFLIFSQFVLIIYSVFNLKNKIALHLKLSKRQSFFILLLLLAPVFYEIKVINVVLSEALAYPLYLLIVGNLFDFIATKHFKNIVYSCLLLLILIQVRGQFMFLVVVMLVAVLISKTNETFSRKHWFSLLAILAIPFISISIDIAFHKIQHHKAVSTPWTGLQIATLPFFISDKNDYQILDTKLQKDYFKCIYSNLEKKKLLLNQVPEEPLSKIDFYFENYVKISNRTVGDNGELFFKDKSAIDELVIENDKMASSITIPLIKNNFLNWSKLYFQNIAKGIGNAKYIILVILLLLFSLVKLQKEENIYVKFIIIGTLLIIGNVTIVALAEPTTSRYLFYNNWILLSIVMLLFQLSFYKKIDE